MIAGLLVGVWVARYLGPEQLGIFSYAIAFTAIFGGISKLGLDGIVVRELVKDPDKRDVYLGTAFWLKLFGAFVTLGLVVITTFFTSNDQLTNLYIYIIASGMIFQSFEVVDFYFQANVRAKFVSICKMVQLFLSSLLKIYFVVSGKPLFWFVAVSLIDQISLAVSYYIAYKMQNNRSFYGKFDIRVAKGLLKDSWPLILSSLAIMIYMRIDQIMIKEMLGTREVGLYSVAVQLTEVWYFIPMSIASTLLPEFSKLRNYDYSAYVQKIFSIIFLSALSILLVVVIFKKNIILILFGVQYEESVTVLGIYIFSILFGFIGAFSTNCLIAENLVKHAFYRTFGGCVVNIILNGALIPIYGLNGAALSTVISQVYASWLHDFISSDTRHLFYIKTKTYISLGLYNFNLRWFV